MGLNVRGVHRKLSGATTLPPPALREIAVVELTVLNQMEKFSKGVAELSEAANAPKSLMQTMGR